MSTHIIRQNTLAIDLHNLISILDIEDVHYLIQQNFPATVDNLLSLSVDSYKRQIYVKTISAHVAERFLNYCGGSIDYQQNNTIYKLTVSMAEDDFIPVNVATVPYECTNEHLRHFFAQYGDIARIVQLSHAKHLLFPIDSGRRLVVFKNNTS